MNKDKKILYSISVLIFTVLFISLFVDFGSSKVLTACLLLPLTIITCIFIKKRSLLSTSKREVLVLFIAIGALYVLLMQLSGLFFGFYKPLYSFSLATLVDYVLPLTLIIIAIEIIRSVMLAQKNRFVAIICYISCVIAEVLMCSNISGIGHNVYAFMNLVGMTFFPAITANLLYHYLSKRYGILPAISYRLITTLYIYFVPHVSGISDSMTAFIKLILPLVLLIFVRALFEGNKKPAKKLVSSRIQTAVSAAAIFIMLSIVMLISCQFRYGALVIATESMTGEINKGDVIIYERYDGQPVKEGQVIVFEKDGSKIVHRVVEIEISEGAKQYYTKGDANDSLDFGYIDDSHIIGLTQTKISGLGFPTLWLHDIVSRKIQ